MQVFCACVRAVVHPTPYCLHDVYVCMYMYIYIFDCVCVCVLCACLSNVTMLSLSQRKRERAHIQITNYIHTHVTNSLHLIANVPQLEVVSCTHTHTHTHTHICYVKMLYISLPDDLLSRSDIHRLSLSCSFALSLSPSLITYSLQLIANMPRRWSQLIVMPYPPPLTPGHPCVTTSVRPNIVCSLLHKFSNVSVIVNVHK
jgi:hypothetical protein